MSVQCDLKLPFLPSTAGDLVAVAVSFRGCSELSVAPGCLESQIAKDKVGAAIGRSQGCPNVFFGHTLRCKIGRAALLGEILIFGRAAVCKSGS